MASIPIEISTAMHTAIKALVTTTAYVYARGVKTDRVGVAASGDIEIERVFPLVDIIPNERVPQQYNSVLLSYPVMVRVGTYAPDDPWQVDLYTIANIVAEYLSGPPTLSLTSAKFDAFVIEGPPDVGERGPNNTQQVIEWSTLVNVRDL